MLVEDTTAFIEQLEVRRPDRRADKRRRRRTQVEIAVLRAEWETRSALEALRKVEDELASLPEPAQTSPGRRLLHARRRRSLRHQADTFRARASAKQQEVLAARERLRLLDGGRREPLPPGAKVFRLHSAGHHLECSEERFARLAGSQADLPVLAARRDGRSWWWYRDRFWWDDEGLDAREVRIVVLDAELAQRRQAEALAQARSRLLGEERGDSDPSQVSQVVRFAVWCRDRGRCVDCGTGDDVGFDQILPLARKGPKTAANVELRCEACRERRAHNQVRARVGRARVDARSHVL